MVFTRRIPHPTARSVRQLRWDDRRLPHFVGHCPLCGNALATVGGCELHTCKCAACGCDVRWEMSPGRVTASYRLTACGIHRWRHLSSTHLTPPQPYSTSTAYAYTPQQ